MEICVSTRNLRRIGPFVVGSGRRERIPGKTQEEQMNTKRLVLASFAVMVLTAGTVQAGPCDTTGRTANLKDAGAGPASTGPGQTTGTNTGATQHPPADTMNRATGDVAVSSQDTQKQMQGEPTAAQQAEGAKATGQMADKGC
jgi:hypothetical protein